MRINTNISAMNTYSRLTAANTAKSGSLAKLSSGLRINKAGDDAAGLAISEKMKNQISGMTQASRNAQDGISLIQTAEGALKETHSILNRMRDLTVQASNDTNTTEDRAAIQEELTSLTDEIGRIAKDTEFNTKGLLNGTTGAQSEKTVSEEVPNSSAYAKLSSDGKTKLHTHYKNELNEGLNEVDDASDIAANNAKELSDLETALEAKESKALDALTAFNTETENDLEAESMFANETKTTTTPASFGSNKFTFQIGANEGENISVTIGNMTAEGLGIDKLNVNPDEIVRGDDPAVEGNQDTFGAMLETIDSAIKSVSDERANLGAVQNRLDHTVSNLATTKENLSEANSRITDVDMAEEMMSFTKSNILSQAATSMLAQANQMPQGVLQLLG